MNKKIALTIVVVLLLGFGSIAPAHGETVNCTAITRQSLPRTISASGVYCLHTPLDYSSTTGAAITVAADGVVIDMNGFELKATTVPNSAAGIYAHGINNIEVKNGTVTNFESPVFIENNGGADTQRGNVVDSVKVNIMPNGTMEGIRLDGVGSIVRNCQVMGSAPAFGYGIIVIGSSSRIINNDVWNSDVGIYAKNASGVIIENNRIGNATQLTTGIKVASSTNVSVINNRMTNFSDGLFFNASSNGKYRDNVTENCTTPFTGGTDIGNNN